MRPHHFYFKVFFENTFEDAYGKGKRIANIHYAGLVCPLGDVHLTTMKKVFKRNTLMIHEWEQKRVSQMSYDAKGWFLEKK